MVCFWEDIGSIHHTVGILAMADSKHVPYFMGADLHEPNEALIEVGVL